MGLASAYEKLGYRLAQPISDWSAENDTGICISIWPQELERGAVPPKTDSRVNADPIENWGHKPGNTKRRKHLAKAMNSYDGWVDVVLLHGAPGGPGSVKAADP